MTGLRTIFAGTPEFACPALAALLRRDDVSVVAVYTQPDRRAGRGQKLNHSAVKTLAGRHQLDVIQPENFRDDETVDAFRALQPDLLVVAAYGLILPAKLLDIAPTNLNVHASLLPRWRGAAPIQRAIMAGDTMTGISIMRVVEQLDAGPVWIQRECAIAGDETGGSLHDKLAALGGEALDAAITMLRTGQVHEQPQQTSAVTYAAKITRADRELDWTRSGVDLERQIRALAPLPGALTRNGSLELKILNATHIGGPPGQAAGTLLDCSADGIDFACADGRLRVRRLQPAGRQPMSAAEFANGYGQQL